MNMQTNLIPESGAVIEVPLNKLGKSPRNARFSGHSPVDIETLAASIGAKGLLQPLVVEPERDGEGGLTGGYLVTIGEGRRLAHLVLAKRKQIKKDHPVRCIVDTTNDAHEISLDENVTRFAMHPADQFEAFQRLSNEKGLGAEEIAARFGVTATVVRQRLKLASVSPELMALYREGEISLEQLMAFAVTDDHERQEAVWAGLGWSREPATIRRLLTQDRVSHRDRRAVFVGIEAYEAAGGLIERDLFAEDGGGWFADPALLEGLALQGLEAVAETERQAGWKWAEACIDYPSAHGLRRLYAKERPLTEAEAAARERLTAEYDALHAEWEGIDEVPDEVMERLDALDTEIADLEVAAIAYDPADVAVSGVFVVLAHNGAVRIERGFVRAEDEPTVSEPNADEEPEGEQRQATKRVAGLPDKLVTDLTAHRTAALRHALGDNPQVALTALTHAMVLQTFFFGYDLGSCLEVKATSIGLAAHAAGFADSKAGLAIEARHGSFAARLPDDPAEVWATLEGWTPKERLAILAHCVGASVNALHSVEAKPRARDHAAVLAGGLSLDMADYWSPTVESYLGRVPKALIIEAVREARSPADASRIEMMKKPDMAAEAERLLSDHRWLPGLLRA